ALRRREVVVEDDQVDGPLFANLLDLLDLAFANVGGDVDATPPLDGAADDFGARGGGKLGQFFEVFVGGGDGDPGETHADKVGPLDPRTTDEFERGSFHRGGRAPILLVRRVSIVFL